MFKRENELLREKIQKQTDEFIKKGGKIKHIESGVSAIDSSKNRLVSSRKNNKEKAST